MFFVNAINKVFQCINEFERFQVEKLFGHSVQQSRNYAIVWYFNGFSVQWSAEVAFCDLSCIHHVLLKTGIQYQKFMTNTEI